MNAENLTEAYYISNEMKELQRQKNILESGAGVDVGAFGVAAKSFGDRIVTGPTVHTIFKTDGVGKEFA